MAHFKITWAVDVDADTPEEAAWIAQKYQRNTDTTATFFDVQDEQGNITQIDLYDYSLEDDEE
jgi:hypothetical protein